MPSTKASQTKRAKRHNFFLNPYPQEAFTKCPKCGQKTKLRKVPLVIHIEPQQLLTLNKTCRFCPSCDLLIAKQFEIEQLIAAGCATSKPQIIGNDYLVFGTMDRKDWLASKRGDMPSSEFIARVYLFKDLLHFEIIPAGWYPTAKPRRAR